MRRTVESNHMTLAVRVLPRLAVTFAVATLWLGVTVAQALTIDNNGAFSPATVLVQCVKCSNGKTSRCTGALISQAAATTRWVLTAAHCVKSLSVAADYKVQLQNGTVLDVASVSVHPVSMWELGKLGNLGKIDVAVLRLAKAVNSPIRTFVAPLDRVTITSDKRIYVDGYQGGFENAAFRTVFEETPEWKSRYAAKRDDGGAVEGGDSGGPGWSHRSKTEDWVYGVTVQGSGGAIQTGAWAFYDWFQRLTERGELDVNNPESFKKTHPRDRFCTSKFRCKKGEGDCDSDSDCMPGLKCKHGWAGHAGIRGDTYDVCHTGEQVWAKQVDCGSVHGGCLPFQGHCDSAKECAGNLVCVPHVGAAIGISAERNVCDWGKMPDCQYMTGWNDAGSARDPDPPDPNHCTIACPCGLGDGDCDNDEECRGDLVCKHQAGPKYGFSSDQVDVCVHPNAL